MWGVATCLIKLSILFFYLDIFEIRSFQIAVYICMAFVAALQLAVILGTLLLCKPLAYSWNKLIPGGHCGDATENYLAIGVVNMVIDFAIVLLPMPILYGLQMSARNKVAIMGILSLGLL